jgi:hypothetical protein
VEEEVVEPPKKKSKLTKEVVEEYEENYDKTTYDAKQKPDYLKKMEEQLKRNESVSERLLTKPIVESDSESEDEYSSDEEEDDRDIGRIQPTRMEQLERFTIKGVPKQTRAARPPPVRESAPPPPVEDPMEMLRSLGVGNGTMLIDTFKYPALYTITGALEKTSENLKGLTKNVKENKPLLKAYDGMLKEKVPDFLINISDTKLFIICMTICFMQTYTKNKYLS